MGENKKTVEKMIQRPIFGPRGGSYGGAPIHFEKIRAAFHWFVCMESGFVYSK
jgi:hypothetical protein